MDTASNIAHYIELLNREGYEVIEHTDMFVTFEARDRTFVLSFAPDDPEYFRLILPNFATVDEEVDSTRVSVAASQVTAEVKAAKVFVVEGNVWATIETLCVAPGHLDEVFARFIELLDAAANHFTSLFTDRSSTPVDVPAPATSSEAASA